MGPIPRITSQRGRGTGMARRFLYRPGLNRSQFRLQTPEPDRGEVVLDWEVQEGYAWVTTLR